MQGNAKTDVMQWFAKHNMDLAGWARAYGVKENTAWVVLRRFSGRDRRPRPGTIAEHVIQALEATTGIHICGGKAK